MLDTMSPSQSGRSAVIDITPPVEKAFLVAVDTGNDQGWNAEDSLGELASLADTAGAEVVGAEWQNRRHIDPNWYLGKGKAEELVDAKARDRLHAAHRRRRALAQPAEGAGVRCSGVKVLDRTGLILDIFAQHARTHEGRLQVELAQLEYQLPRLTRLWTHLSRTRRRHRHPRTRRDASWRPTAASSASAISKLKERVEDVRRQRETAARARDRRLVPTRRHRRLHQRRQDLAAQRAHRHRGRARRGPALRDARPDQPLGEARRRPVA